MSEDSLDGPPVDVLTEVDVGDEVELYFDRYNEGYAETPQSPVRSTVLEVESTELPADNTFPGTLRTVTLTVAEDDETADKYWIEHRTEYDDDGERQSASHLLYENEMLATITTTGSVGHIDRIVVLSDEE